MRIDSIKVGDIVRSPICDYPTLWDNSIVLHVEEYVSPGYMNQENPHARIMIYWLWSDGTINRQKYGKDYDADMTTY